MKRTIILLLFILFIPFVFQASAQCFTEVQKYDSSDIDIYFQRRFMKIKSITTKTQNFTDSTITFYKSYVGKAKLQHSFTDNGVEYNSVYRLYCPGVTISEFFPILQQLYSDIKQFNLTDSLKRITGNEYDAKEKKYFPFEIKYTTKQKNEAVINLYYSYHSFVEPFEYSIFIEQTKEDTITININYWTI